MSDIEQTSPQMQMIRQSLLNSVFQKFNELRGAIAALPINQQNIGIGKSLSFFDDGIVWAKEVILNAPIELKKTEEPVAEIPLSSEASESTAVLDDCVEEVVA